MLSIFLTNWAHSLDLGLHVLADPPLTCVDLLFQDGIGVSFPHSVVV